MWMKTEDFPLFRKQFKPGQKYRIHVRKESKDLSPCTVLRTVRVIGVYPFFVLFQDKKGIRYTFTYPELLEKKLCSLGGGV